MTRTPYRASSLAALLQQPQAAEARSAPPLAGQGLGDGQSTAAGAAMMRARVAQFVILCFSSNGAGIVAAPSAGNREGKE